jgi:GntR family histidine utilization transcriptional repressor
MTAQSNGVAEAADSGGARSARRRADERPQGSPSLHSQIIAEIETKILSGEWPPGHRIPFEHELTDFYGCSRMTVSKALTQLARAGLIERRRKAGSFVMRPRGQSALLEIRDVASEVAALGLPYRFEVLARRKRRATAAGRSRIDAPRGAPLLAVGCRHDAGPRPFCYEERLINLAAVPSAAAEPFATLSPGAWLAARQPWTTAEHRIRAAAADRKIADILRIAEGAPCLVVERRTWLAGLAVTQVTFTYPAGVHELVATFAPSNG